MYSLLSLLEEEKDKEHDNQNSKFPQAPRNNTQLLYNN